MIEWDHDALGRVVQERWLDWAGAALNTITSTWDAAGQLLAISDADAAGATVSAYAFTYDIHGNILTTDNTGTPDVPDVVLTSTFDGLSRRTSLSATIDGTADFVNAYSFDMLGRMTRIEQTDGAPVAGYAVGPKRVDFAYTPGGAFETISRYEDLAGTWLVVESAYGYDDAGRLISLDHAQDTLTLAAYDWQYDVAGRVVEFTSSADGTATYSYDNTSQVTAADRSDPAQADEAFSYDENGNRTLTGYVSGANNRLLSDGTYDYAYDAEGNRIRRTTIATGAYVEYEWDHRNRLVGLVMKDAPGNVVDRVEYRYDAFDRLIVKRYRLIDGELDERDAFVYDDPTAKGGLSDILLEFGTLGSLTHRYLHGPAVDQVLADEVFADPDTLWLLADNQGTIRDAVVSDGPGEVTSSVLHRRYGAFGQITFETNALDDWTIRHGHTGRIHDAESGLIYHRGRWLDPLTGLWTVEDPSGFTAGDTNLNRYVGNSPANFTDPSGESAVGKVLTKPVLKLLKSRLRDLLLKKLAQIHHVLPQHLFKHPELGPWLKNLGFGKNAHKNLIPLPTRAGKACNIGAKRALHDGGHLGKYFDNIRKQLQAIYDRHAKKSLTDAQAKAQIELLQQTMKNDLRTGKVLLHNEGLMENYGPLLALAFAGASKAELDQIATGQTEAIVQTIEQHPGMLFRAETYLGDVGKWLDWINPGDDIATIYDLDRLVHVMSGKDPRGPSSYEKCLDEHFRVTGEPFFAGPKY